jgi:hypothetical protein
MVAVQSSAILRISDPSDPRGLVITFATGKTYQYFGVPQAVQRALLAAPSKGRFFNEQIRSRYPYRLLSGDSARRRGA